MDMEVFLQKERFFLGAHKIGAAISGPRIADTNITDTRIFLNLGGSASLFGIAWKVSVAIFVVRAFGQA